MNKAYELTEAIKFMMKVSLNTTIPDNMQAKEEIDTFLDLAKESYVIVTWPESQELMEEDWFEDEAILEVEAKFGSSAYFIPLKRLL